MKKKKAIILEVCPHMCDFGGGKRYYHPSNSGTISEVVAKEIWDVVEKSETNKLHKS